MVAQVSWLDVFLVELCFLGLISPGVVWVAIRLIREIRAQRRRDQTEAEALRAEGFSPAAPPATVDPTPSPATLDEPTTEKPPDQ